LPLFQKSLEIYKKVLEEGHPDIALSLNNLARLYNITGDYEKAEPLLQQALPIASCQIAMDCRISYLKSSSLS